MEGVRGKEGWTVRWAQSEALPLSGSWGQRKPLLKALRSHGGGSEQTLSIDRGACCPGPGRQDVDSRASAAHTG